MFEKLFSFNNSKISWGILLAGSLVLLACSLSFQHILNLEPCVLCIYQRISIMLIIIASLFPLIFGSNNNFAKYPSYVVWISSSILGLWASVLQWKESYLAQKAIDEGRMFFSSCGQGLEQYFPSIEKSEFLSNIFIARGICSEIDWSFLGLEMHHYMFFIFGIFLIASLAFAVINTVYTLKK